jgi:NAD(P)-dependent dehydrogenase (short-subunit alcohol dehydrogenase family)
MTPPKKTVLLTGAAGNLGSAVAQVFAHDGANLVLLDRSPLSDTVRASLVPALCLAIALDLCDAAQVLVAVDQVTARFGRIDVLSVASQVFQRRESC